MGRPAHGIVARAGRRFEIRALTFGNVDYTIEFLADGGPADVAITIAGELTGTEFRELTGALMGDPRFRAGLALLVDVTALETAGVSDDALGQLSEPVVERDWQYPPRAVAIVAPADETFRSALSYRAHLGGSKSKRHVVRTREEALAWLEQN